MGEPQLLETRIDLQITAGALGTRTKVGHTPLGHLTVTFVNEGMENKETLEFTGSDQMATINFLTRALFQAAQIEHQEIDKLENDPNYPPSIYNFFLYDNEIRTTIAKTTYGGYGSISITDILDGKGITGAKAGVWNEFINILSSQYKGRYVFQNMVFILFADTNNPLSMSVAEMLSKPRKPSVSRPSPGIVPNPNQSSKYNTGVIQPLQPGKLPQSQYQLPQSQQMQQGKQGQQLPQAQQMQQQQLPQQMQQQQMQQQQMPQQLPQQMQQGQQHSPKSETESQIDNYFLDNLQVAASNLGVNLNISQKPNGAFFVSSPQIQGNLVLNRGEITFTLPVSANWLTLLTEAGIFERKLSSPNRNQGMGYANGETQTEEVNETDLPHLEELSLGNEEGNEEETF